MSRVWFLQLANLLSGMANSIVVITIPWLVLEVTDSATFAGLVVALSSLPALLISPFGGVVISKFGKRGVSIGADIFSMVSVVAFPLFAIMFGLSGWAILVIALIGAIFDPLGYTARKTLISDVSAASGFDVERHNGIHEGLLSVAWIAGPAVGAWLIALVGAVNSFWFAGGLFALAGIAISLLKISSSLEKSSEDTSSMTQGALLGFRLIWRDRLLRTILVSVLIIAAVYLPSESVILPAYFEAQSQPTSLGIVISALAAGSALSAFGYGWIIKRVSGRTLIRLSFVGASGFTLAMSFLPPLALMLLAAFALGLSWGPFAPFLNSLTQRRIPEQDQPAVFSAQTAVFYAAPPVGMVIAGLGVEAFGIAVAYQTLGWLLVITALLTLTTKALREKY